MLGDRCEKKSTQGKGMPVKHEGSRGVWVMGSRPLFYVFRMLSFCAGISGSLVIHCGP